MSTWSRWCQVCEAEITGSMIEHQKYHMAVTNPMSAVTTPQPSPADRIRSRITEKRALYEHYKVHATKMLLVEDAHGAWDASVNMSEMSCEIDGLSWALAIVEGREP